MYNGLQKRTDIVRDVKTVMKFNFLNGAYFEAISSKTLNYNVKFIDSDNGQIIHNADITNNMWTKTSRAFHTNWKILVTDVDTGTIQFYHVFDAKDKRVYISLDSRSLGDTLAWIPYVEEYRKKHGCTIICSTFMNHMFENTYPDIQFVNPGTNVTDIYAMYQLGLYYTGDEPNLDKNKNDPKKVPLQQVCTDILGLDYTEIRPKIHHQNVKREPKLVTIGIHSTAQSKYWNNPNGWQELVDWLKSEGYTVRIISKEGDGYMGNVHPTGVEVLNDSSMENTMNELLKSEFFIGISSGLSWLSWGLEIPTVLISGFSYDYTEMKDCIRISAPPDTCSGCFNRLRLDPGDWNWCPDHKGTIRKFECSKQIKSSTVIDTIRERLINKK